MILAISRNVKFKQSLLEYHRSPTHAYCLTWVDFTMIGLNLIYDIIMSFVENLSVSSLSSYPSPYRGLFDGRGRAATAGIDSTWPVHFIKSHININFVWQMCKVLGSLSKAFKGYPTKSKIAS